MNRDTQWQVDHQSAYQSCYCTVLHTVDARYDVRGSVLAEMVKACLIHRATLPAAQRAYFVQHASEEAVTYLEKFTARLFFGPQGRFSPQEYRYRPAIDLLEPAPHGQPQ
ncbi:hypothetical protein HB13667_05545 [Pseudomonas putida]|jgi:hypothetical protein|uniref:Uncharacterized protein n=1 Tax=Pseudomonas putida TaxID=303 RepID=A0A0P7DDC5_PSEPU|nr:MULTISPECIES: hypothetical protein [Pseudomonas]AGN83528.1 hypothetical protein L483_32155 [Pseudomonas putida H8234]AUY34871.1 hypothetical protein C3F42_17365 [Pseudomonas sp. PONIH3]EKV4187060.1 hypothetical protein [Pseudomonas aeruginosa]KPM67752.1 hypothetical protein HB13667_05545 [Pseudomonas putida]MBH3381758.1 hypothetical protein [Pseudomonas asiatica]